MNSSPSKPEKVQDLRDSSHSPAQVQAAPETSATIQSIIHTRGYPFTQSTEHLCNFPSVRLSILCSIYFIQRTLLCSIHCTVYSMTYSGCKMYAYLIKSNKKCIISTLVPLHLCLFHYVWSTLNWPSGMINKDALHYFVHGCSAEDAVT